MKTTNETSNATMGEQSKHERYVRENVEAVYGAGSTVQVDDEEGGGHLRILGSNGKRVAGSHWDASSTSQRTQDQAWYALAGIVLDDAKAKASKR